MVPATRPSSRPQVSSVLGEPHGSFGKSPKIKALKVIARGSKTRRMLAFPRQSRHISPIEHAVANSETVLPPAQRRLHRAI